MSEPIKPATDEEISLMWPIYQADTAADGMVRMLFKRIESDAAKLKALELERETIQEYADRIGANLTAAEGTLKERDEQIAALRRDFVDSCPCPQCPTEAEKRRTEANRG